MNAISPPVQAVLDLFADPLRELCFADVDATTLGELAASVQAAAAVVLAAETELARQRHTLLERQDALLQHAQRALAYARVYAETDAGLTERLDQIALPRGSRRPRIDGDALVLEPGPASRARKASATGEPKKRRPRPLEATPDESVLNVELPSAV
ncbi:MAG: hypothetical protein ACLQVI_32740 [Polyangiaceae bacterium]